MPSKRVSLKLKTEVAERAKSCCEYCRSQEAFSPDPFFVDHIVPIAKAGKHESSNLAFSCQGCNNCKYDSTHAPDPVTQAVVLLYNPRYHIWGEQFACSDDCSEIVGLTATGRATVKKLRLNRSGLLNFRRILYSSGEHPPSL